MADADSKLPPEPPGVGLRMSLDSPVPPARIADGIAAATSTLRELDITPWQAAWAHWWRQTNRDTMSAKEHDWARAWESAQAAALQACSADTAVVTGSLELNIPDRPAPRNNE